MCSMTNHTIEEINKAIKEFDDNPYRYENISIESIDIAIDCMRSCLLAKRKAEKSTMLESKAIKR